MWCANMDCATCDKRSSAAGLSQIGEFSFLIGSRVGAQAAALDRGLQLDLQRDGAVVGAEDVVADARGAHAVGD